MAKIETDIIMIENIIKDMRILNKFAKQGLIKLHNDTGKKVRNCFGKLNTIYYVDSIPKPFEIDNNIYVSVYTDGNVNPYLAKIKKIC